MRKLEEGAVGQFLPHYQKHPGQMRYHKISHLGKKRITHKTTPLLLGNNNITYALIV